MVGMRSGKGGGHLLIPDALFLLFPWQGEPLAQGTVQSVSCGWGAGGTQSCGHRGCLSQALRSSSVPAPRPRTPPQPWEGLSGASDDQWSRGSWDFED